MHPTPRALIGLALAATAAAQPKVAGRPDQPSAEAIEQRVQKIVGAKYPTAGGVGGAAEGFRDLLRAVGSAADASGRSEEHTSELQSLTNLVCRLLLEKKKKPNIPTYHIAR